MTACKIKSRQQNTPRRLCRNTQTQIHTQCTSASKMCIVLNTVHYTPLTQFRPAPGIHKLFYQLQSHVIYVTPATFNACILYEYAQAHTSIASSSSVLVCAVLLFHTCINCSIRLNTAHSTYEIP